MAGTLELTMRPSSPLHVPDIRLRLVELWQPGGAYHHVALRTEMVVFGDRLTYANWEWRNTVDARCWWVGEDMCDLLDHAAAGIPAESNLLRGSIPDLSGLVVFARPLESTDSKTTNPITVDAVVWGPAMLHTVEHDGTTPVEAPSLPCITFSSYQWWDERNMFVPLGRSDWPIGERLDAMPPQVDLPDNYAESAMEDRRRMLALWTLASQRRIAELTDRHPGRASDRRHQRAGVTPSPVRVCVLRRPLSEPAGAPGTHPVQWSHRWIVEGHWRSTPCGPGRKDRRPVYIAPHIKGPEGKPLLGGEKVKAVIR